MGRLLALILIVALIGCGPQVDPTEVAEATRLAESILSQGRQRVVALFFLQESKSYVHTEASVRKGLRAWNSEFAAKIALEELVKISEEGNRIVRQIQTFADWADFLDAADGSKPLAFEDLNEQIQDWVASKNETVKARADELDRLAATDPSKWSLSELEDFVETTKWVENSIAVSLQYGFEPNLGVLNRLSKSDMHELERYYDLRLDLCENALSYIKWMRRLESEVG